MAAPSVGLTQEVMCDPCVDYPEWRSPIPESSPVAETNDLRLPADGRVNLGSSISNLRGLNTAFGSRTLTLIESRRMREEPLEDSGEAISEEEAAEFGDSDDARTGNVESRDEEVDPGTEAIERSDW
jgi:hypothetical protein